MRKFAIAAALTFFTGQAIAAPTSANVSLPYGASTTVTAGTVTAGNTFQVAIAASVQRKSCSIVNKSTTAVLFVFVGPNASATTGTSFVLPVATAGADGGVFSCSLANDGVMIDSISVTSGTSTSPFLVVVNN